MFVCSGADLPHTKSTLKVEAGERPSLFRIYFHAISHALARDISKALDVGMPVG